jgi:hypothetical protein
MKGEIHLSLHRGRKTSGPLRIPPERSPSILSFLCFESRRRENMKAKFVSFFIIPCIFILGGCVTASVQKDLVWSKDFQPQQYQLLAVIDMDPQIQFAEYVAAELLKKGYKIKEGSTTRQMLKKEGLLKEEFLDSPTLSKIGKMLKVQGIVLCSVLEFSRFRDSYRLNIKMVAPDTGNILWFAQGAMEGKKGQKSSELLQRIVASSLKKLPSAP